MQKLSAFTMCVSLIIFSVSAYVGYSGNADMRALSNNPGTIEANGSDWSMTFSNKDTDSGDTGLLNKSFSGKSVNFTGIVDTPTPCHKLTAEVKREGENSYRFEITAERISAPSGRNIGCAQVITPRKYGAHFESDNPFKLEVVHRGESVENLTSPNFSSSEGLITKIIEFLTSLV